MEQAALILVYHSVVPDGESVERATQVSARVFRAQLAWLRRLGYSAVPVSDLLAAAPSAPARRVAITFDDGYADNCDVAAPILRAFGMTATFFVATDFIGGRALFNQDWQPPMMDWRHLIPLADNGMEIGSHTCSHPHLPELGSVGLRRELCASRALLEARLGRPVWSVAYPHGLHSPAVLHAAETAGYRVGLAVDQPASGDRGRFALPRTMMLDTDHGPRLLLKWSPMYQKARGKRG